MAYRMSLLDAASNEEFDLQLGTTGVDGITVTTPYVPPTPRVDAQTFQPYSPTEMPGRHESTRSYLTEDMPLVIKGPNTARVQTLARDLEWYLERANNGYVVYLVRRDLVTATSSVRSRVLVGELSLAQDSEFQFRQAQPDVNFRLQLTRDAWWEGDRVQLNLAATNAGTGAATLSRTSGASAFIRTAIPGVLATPLELRWQWNGSGNISPEMITFMLVPAPMQTVTHTQVLTTAATSITSAVTDVAKTSGVTFTPQQADWYRIIAEPATATNLTPTDTLHDMISLRAVGGFLSQGDDDWVGEWKTFGRLLGRKQRYTDLGALYIERSMRFFLQGVANLGSSVSLPAITLHFVPTNGFRGWSARRIEPNETMIDTPTDAYIAKSMNARLPLETLDGASLMAQPGETPQIIPVFQDRTVGNAGGSFTLQVFTRPRFLTI